MALTIILQCLDAFGLLHGLGVGWHYLRLVDFCDLLTFLGVGEQAVIMVLDLFLAQESILIFENPSYGQPSSLTFLFFKVKKILYLR